MMKRFSIKQLARLSDIRQHTIRAWERRYGFLAPERSTGNVRHYSIDDLERLLYLVLLKDQGEKITYLSKLNVIELNDLALKLESITMRIQRSLHRLIICLYKFDIESFEKILDESSTEIGYDLTIHSLIIPFLFRTDILSYKFSTADIHFAVTATRKKLMTGIDQVKPIKPNFKTALLYLPKGEHYDLVLLYVYYCLKYQGFKVYYLGTNVSEENLKLVIGDKRPDELYVYSNEPKKYDFENILTYLKSLSRNPTLTIVTPLITSGKKSGVKYAHIFELQTIFE